MAVEWKKCQGGVWCDLYKLNLDHEYFSKLNGVFIVWYEKKGQNIVLKVGAGNIVSELKKIMNDLALKAFAEHGLHVSWADVSKIQQPGTLKYLIQSLTPKMQDNSKAPKAIPMKIAYPWEQDDDEYEDD